MMHNMLIKFHNEQENALFSENNCAKFYYTTTPQIKIPKLSISIINTVQ